MMRNLLLLITFLSFVPALAQAQNLFGSIEFRAASLEALPKWTTVLKKVSLEQHLFNECDENLKICEPASLAAWRKFIQEHKGQVNQDTVQALNDFINQWGYVNDIQNWGVSDYWATPMEFLNRSGDCEDYAILKFVALKELGFPADNMRLVVVQDVVREIAHAVLAVYLEGEEPLIMDSLFNVVLPHTEVLQYVPYYSVNETTRWAHIMPHRD